MLRRMACVGVLLALSVGLVMAEEFNVRGAKIDGNKITGTKGGTFNKDTKKFEGGTEVSLTVAAGAKVVKGKFNKDTKKVEAGDPIEGGLSSVKAGKKGGLNLRVTTDNDGKVTEIIVLGGKGGKKKKGAE